MNNRNNDRDNRSQPRGDGRQGAYGTNRDDRSFGRYGPQDRGVSPAGNGMSLRDEYEDRLDRPYGPDDGYGVYGDGDQGYGPAYDGSPYSDRDMGNLERDRYGRGSQARGGGAEAYPTRYQSRQAQAREAQSRQTASGPDRSGGEREVFRPAEGGPARGEQGGYGAYSAGGDERWGSQRQRDQGPHYGRGPKNYQRSDDRIREDVNEQLTYHHDLDATDIEVRAENGEVTLSGTVPDRRQKRMAEDAADGVRGVKDVHNQLRVQTNQGATLIPGADDDQRGSAMSTTQMSGGDTTGLTTSGTTTSSAPAASGRRNASNKQQ